MANASDPRIRVRSDPGSLGSRFARIRVRSGFARIRVRPGRAGSPDAPDPPVADLSDPRTTSRRRQSSARAPPPAAPATSELVHDCCRPRPRTAAHDRSRAWSRARNRNRPRPSSTTLRRLRPSSATAVHRPRLSTAVHGLPRPPTAVHGRGPVHGTEPVHGHPRPPSSAHGRPRPRPSTDQGCPLPSTAVHGRPRPPTAVHGFPRETQHLQGIREVRFGFVLQGFSQRFSEMSLGHMVFDDFLDFLERGSRDPKPVENVVTESHFRKCCSSTTFCIGYAYFKKPIKHCVFKCFLNAVRTVALANGIQCCLRSRPWTAVGEF